MNLKKMFAVFICIFLATSIIGCNDKNEKPDKSKGNQGDPSQTEELEIDYTSHLIDEDYDGYDFRIYIRPGKTTDQYVEEETGDTVNDAVYRRNQIVADMYNITFSMTESISSDAETGALNTILAGDDAYDVIFPHSRSAFIYALRGSLMNWNDIPNIDLSKPWWAQDLRESADINGKLYVMDGDISMHSIGFTGVMTFNKDIFDELGLDYPYQMVRDGEWTFDEFERLATLGTKDLNGDGVITAEDDRIGFITSEWSAPITVLYAGGQRIYDKKEDGIPQLTLYNEQTVYIYDRFFSFLDTDNAFCKHAGGMENYFGEDHFRNNRAMFDSSSLYSVISYRDMESDFGILPWPKFDKDANYATNINGHAHLVVVPVTVYDHIDKTGAIIEALCAIGSREVLPAFYDVALKTKFTRDDESSEMLDIIRASRVYDLGYISGGTFQSTGYDLSRSTSHDFSSYYAQNESAALIKLEEFVEEYGKDR